LRSGGGKKYDKGSGIELNSDGRIYVAGEFESPANFDPGSNTANVIVKERTYGSFLASYSENKISEIDH
jgi:hypothetical protein